MIFLVIYIYELAKVFLRREARGQGMNELKQLGWEH